MPKIHRTLWFRFFLLTLLSSMAWAQLPVADDTFVASGTTTPQGTNTNMQVIASPINGALVRFDLSGLPPGTTIGQVTQATAKLYLNTVSLSGSIDVCEVTGSWSEANVVYTSRPVLNPAAIQANVPVSTASKYVVLNVTQAVKDWINGTANNGIALLPASASPCTYGAANVGNSINIKFDSKENISTSHDAGLSVVLTLGSSSSGVQSFNTRTGVVTAQPGDYTFGQIAGGINNNTLTIGPTGLLSASSGGTITANMLSAGTYGPNVNISGNAGTVTNGVYTTGSYGDPSWITSLSGAKISSPVANAVFATGAGTTTNFTGSLSGDVTGTQGSTVVSTIGGAAPSLFARRDQSNIFTATQVLAPIGATLQPSNLLQLNAKDASSNSLSAQLQALNDGSLSFQFGPTGSAVQKLSIDNTGKITFAPGQIFPGTTNGTVTQVDTGAGLTGGPITTTGTISIPSAGVTNAMLQNSSVTVTAGTGLSGGGAASLGGSVTINNAGVLTVGAANPLTSTGGQTPIVSLINGSSNGQLLGWNGTQWAATDVSGNFIQNGTAQQASSNFNISGSGVLGGSLTVSGGKSSFAGATNAFASLNIPNGSALPASAVAGDLWLLAGDTHLQFRDNAGTPLTHSLAFTDDPVSNSQVSGTYSGQVDFSNVSNAFSGTFTGNGSALTNLSGGSITAGSVPNTALANPSVTINAGTGLMGGGMAPLGGMVTLANAGVLQVTAADTTITSTGGQTPAIAVGTITNGNLTDNTINAAKIANTAAVLSGGNLFTGGTQKLAASTTNFSSLNFPNGSAPASGNVAIGDLWLTSGDAHLQFQDKTNAQQSLAFLSDFTTGNNTYIGSNTFSGANTFSGGNNFSGSNTFSNNNTFSGATNAFQGITATTLSASSSVSAGSLSSTGNISATGSLSGASLGVSGNIMGNNVAAAMNVSGATGTFSGAVTGGSFSGDGSALTNLTATNLTGIVPTANLPTALVYNNQANTYGAGQKQTFVADAAGMAGLSFGSGIAGSPATSATGDVWFDTSNNHLNFKQNNTTTQSLAFLTDLTGGNNSYTGNNTFSGTNSFTGSTSFAGISASSLIATGSVTANTFSGNGASLTNLNPANISVGTAGINITGTASNVTGTVGIGNGGTGLALASVAAGSYLRGTGTTFAVSPILAADIPSGSGNYIQNGTSQQTTANFNIDGNGILGGSLAVTGGKSSLAGSTMTFASLNIPNGGAVPDNAHVATGDLWLTMSDAHLQFQDKNSNVQSLAFLSDFTAGNNTYTGNNTFSGSNSFSGVNTFNNASNSFSGSFSGALTGTVTGNVTGNVSGNAGTATALAAVPTQCAANTFATGITATGNANCVQPSAANLSNGTSGSGALVLATMPAISNPTITNAVVNQATNGSDALSGKRATDSGSTGNLIHFTNNVGGTDLFVVDVTGALTAGSVPDARLSNNVPLLNQTNTYGAGKKQVFVASSTLAGLNLFGTATDPTGPLAGGDLWFNTGVGHVRFFDGSTTKTLAFTTDLTGGTVTSITAGTGLTGGTITTSGTIALSSATSGTLGGVVAPSCAAGTHYSGISGGTLQCTADTTTTSLSFSAITTGTNNTSLTIGAGGSLNVAGGGTINATSLSGELAVTSATAGTIAARDASGNLSAVQFNGSGAGLTNLNASNLSTGTVPSAQLPPATSAAFGAVRPTIVNNITTPVSQGNNTAVNYSVSCAPGRFVLGGGYTVSDVKLMPTAAFPAAADTWRITLTANGAVSAATVTVYAICSGN